MKKVTNVSTLAALIVLAGASVLSGGQSAAAQESSSSSTRFSVDLKDATLRDALELVFQAAGNPPHIIDPAASQVRIGSVSFKDQEWRDIVRTLANLNKFSFRRENGSWIIDPRSAAQSSRAFSTTTSSSFQMRDKAGFSVETRSNRQFGQGGQVGAGRAGGAGSLSKPPAVDSANPWSIITTDHIYAGSIALFFENATVMSTQAFIVPAAINNISSTNSNGTSGIGGGSGGIGGGGSGGSGGIGGGVSTSR